MKKYLMTGVAALTLCAGFTSCSHDDFEPMTQAQIDKAKYDMAFLNYVGGKIAANQDWGFGSTTRGITRAANQWTETHNHVDGCTGWEEALDFTLPAGAVQIDTDDNYLYTSTTWDGKTVYVYKIPSGDVLYISEDFEGDLQLSEGFNSNVTIYNYGKVTNITLNYVNGTITYYNAGTLAFNLTSGTHIFYNAPDGELTLNGYANVGHVYNNGELYLANSDLRNDLTVHSAGLGIVYFPNGAASGDGLQSTLDIHGKAKVTGDMKIGNDKTQYVCGLEITGTLNLTKGHLQTSYVKANEITFDGDRLYLLPGANVVTNTMRLPNSDTYVFGHTGSNALVEVTDMDIQNQNFFDKVFSANVYFKIGGTIKFTNSSVWDGTWTAAEYVDQTEDGQKVANRLNGGNATGAPACGQPWTVGTPTTTEEYDLRIIAEDLSAQEAGDFDFNDVVFDVKFDASNAKIKILAAGGTLPLRIDGKYEVHAALGAGENEMVNTNANGGVEKEPVEIELGKGITSASEAKGITIEVFKNNSWQTLEAEQGQPAAKMAVSTDYQWLDERASIKDVYPGFIDWVQGQAPREDRWW